MGYKGIGEHNTMLTLQEARNIVLAKLPPGSKIKGETEEGIFYLFLAINPDPLEGNLDPFYSVNKNTGEFIDFSPSEYSNSLDILNRLKA